MQCLMADEADYLSGHGADEHPPGVCKLGEGCRGVRCLVLVTVDVDPDGVVDVGDEDERHDCHRDREQVRVPLFLFFLRGCH